MSDPDPHPSAADSQKPGTDPLLPGQREPDRLVYLVSMDGASGSNLALQLSHFGFYLQIVGDFRSLENAVAEHNAVAVLVDLASFDLGSPLFDHVGALATLKTISLPLMFISEQDDQDMRLMAIRCRGVAFFTRPLDIVSLVDRLDGLQAIDHATPYRVLIVDDEPTVAGYYQMVLMRAGIQTQTVTKAPLVLQTIEDFHPDLVLMDLYMPEASGIELARMIRQMEEYVSTPIVFLSSEDDFVKRMDAMSLGGDDFLTKPIKAAHLVSLVTSRMERLRTLRSYMIRDSLTGLLNHTTFNLYLGQNINRTRRHDGRIALAMLDIDYFKGINDTYGHAFGDTILKGLSRMLKQRLRRSDIIGRYGGEEFVALLLDATPANAYQVMEDIRLHYSSLSHETGQGNAITVTFSCGIATFPEFQTAGALSEAADKALYRAKDNGRNKVLMAGSDIDAL
jgi:diguanylate cyclase (GGDEF)-like protein